MMQNNIVKKGLIIGITLLFVAIAFSPAVNAYNDMIFPKTVTNPRDNVSITVVGYKSDGTIEKSIVKIPQDQIEQFRNELNGAKEFEERLSIYKKHNFVSQDFTVDELRAGTEVYEDVNCQVWGVADYVFGYYRLIPFGTSLFTQFKNSYPGNTHLYESHDVVDFIFGRLHFHSEGEQGFAGGYFTGRIIMKGFVGFFFRGLDRHVQLVQGFDGFASSVKAVGSPLTYIPSQEPYNIGV